MARVRLVWVWLIALIIAVMAAGCGDDDGQPTDQPDVRSDTRTDTAPGSDVRTDAATDTRTDAPTDGTVTPDGTPDTPPPPPDVIPDTPRPPDVIPDTPRPPDADAAPPPPDVIPDTPRDAPIPPPDTIDAPVPPPDVPADSAICTSDNQCPSNKPHCNTGTGQCVSATALNVTPPTASVALGVTQQFTATATWSDTSTSDVSTATNWTSSSTATATISGAGLASTHAIGSSTITGTYGTFSDTSTLTVTAKALVSVGVTPANPSNPAGTTRQFTATGVYTDATTADLTATATWASATTSVATVDAAGLATAVSPGTSLISATSGGITGSTTMTVTNATLVSLAVTPQGPSIPAQSIRPFSVVGTYTDNSAQNLTTQATWTSSNQAIATISNNAGSQGWATGVSAGQTTITAAFGGQTATSTLTVTGATLTSINVTPNTPTVPKGSVVTFTATGVYNDNSTQNLTTLVTWTSSDTNVAVISNTAGSQGFATCANTGPSTITATLGGISGTAALTVTAATLVAIDISPTNPSIAKGTTQQFMATGTYTDFTTQDITSTVTWGSTNAGVGPISNAPLSKGLATGQAVGSTVISATLSGITQTTTLTVTNEVLVAIGVTPANATIAKGNSIQFTAIGTYSDNSTQNLTTTVTWNSSNNAFATISNAGGSQGLANGAGQGVVTITAASGNVAGTTQLTVTQATLSTIALTPPNPSTAKGTTLQFTATGTYSDATTQDLTELSSWSSNNGGVATVSNTALSRGLATAKNTGSATITANYLGVSGSTLLTVTSETLVSIAVTPVNRSVPAGSIQQYQATGIYTDNSTQNLTTQVAWDSSTPSVATISNAGGSQGSATTLIAGQTTITATLGLVAGTTMLTVTPAELQSIAIDPPGPSIAKGTKQQFTATGTYSDSTTLDLTAQVTWSSSDSSKATISNAAGTNGEATAVNDGATTISATMSGVSGSTVLTVTTASLMSIAVTPAGQSIAAGTTLQFTAIGTYSDSSTQDLTTQASWASSGAEASISNAVGSKGLATGASPGSVTITATFALIPGTTGLTITNANLNTIEVLPATATIARGTTQGFTALGHYSNGTTQDLTTQVTWGSLTPSVATVSNAVGTEGLASGIAAGMATVTASFNGVTGTAALTVTAATLSSISVTPASGGINAGDTRQYTAIGTYSDATTQDITQLVLWDSSVPGVALISNAGGTRGLATAIATGDTNITAVMSGKTGTATLHVN
jgi:trimeric autotransporter adhesin